jgi:hypothetical protein
MSPLLYCFARWCRWRCLVGAWLVMLGLSAVAQAQSELSEPDFSGMYAPARNARVVARDSVRGWNYVVSDDSGVAAGTYINGVQQGTLSRVNDRGQLDLGWVVADYLTPSTAIVLGNGELLVQTGLFSTDLQRLQQGADGRYRLQPFRWTAEPLVSTFGAAPATRDAQGNIYAMFSVPGPTQLRQTTLRRVSPEGVPDAQWRLDIDADQGSVSRLTIGDDGSIFFTTLRASESVPGSLIQTINRASVNATDLRRWSQPFTGTLKAITADATGRVYVLGDELAAYGFSGSLLRLNAGGAVDAGWSLTLEPGAASYYADLRAVDNRLVLMAVARENPRPRPAPSVQLISQIDGRVLATRRISGASFAWFLGNDATVTADDAAGLVLLSPALRAEPDFVERRVAFTTGNQPSIKSVLRWGDGYVMAGAFEFWYDGVRYAKLMRLTAALKPDPGWQPVVNGVINVIAIDSEGGLLVAGDKLVDSQTSLLRFSANGQADLRWQSKRFDGPLFALAASADGAVFVGGNFNSVDGTARASVVRFDENADIVFSWAQRPPWGVEPFAQPFSGGVMKIIDAGDGGVLIRWARNGPFDFSDGQWSRLQRTSAGETLALPSTLSGTFSGTEVLLQDPQTGRLYSQQRDAALVRLLPTTLELDPLWIPFYDSNAVIGFSATHLYLVNGRRLNRLANSVAYDPNWFVGRTGATGLTLSTPETRAVVWSAQGAPVIVSLATLPIAARTVVEYFAKDAQRFFMTARPLEQQMLDAQPAKFVRTGMQIGVFDGAVRAPDANANGLVTEAAVLPPPPPLSANGAVPICRFYSSAARGGSNTHFYGRGTDCQFLNTVALVANEGYDFSAPLPKNGSCPANAGTPVFRLFNNLSASNNGNHRYVVSQARIDEMKALGWVNEGVAFCATSALDSRAFAATVAVAVAVGPGRW